MIIKIHHSHNDINNFTEHTKGFLKSKHMESKIKGAHNVIDDSISPRQSPVLSLVLLHLKKIEAEVWDGQKTDVSSMVKTPKGICNETHLTGRICSDCSNQIFPLA